MSAKDATYYDHQQGQLRGILIEVSDQLDPFTVDLVDELIDANEYGVALETLGDMLTIGGASISRDVFCRVSRLDTEMGLQGNVAEPLRPLVIEGTATPYGDGWNS